MLDYGDGQVVPKGSFFVPAAKLLAQRNAGPRGYGTLTVIGSSSARAIER